MLKKIKNYFRPGRLIKLPPATRSYAVLLKKLENNETFAFSRWGDGEWESVFALRNENEANCDGHLYFSSMRESLHKILVSNPPYLMGMQKLAYHKLLGREIDSYLKNNGIFREWLNADAFHDASGNGQIKSFFTILAEKNVLLAGPAHLKKLTLFHFEFCEVPGKNCWLERDRILRDIKEIIRMKQPEVILFCAGMTSNWFIDELHGSFRGFILDVGSLLDPYAGVNSRNYHKKLHNITFNETESKM
ncbi:MAG: hypothetical protein WD824_24495 [Cyclobacteriaceae bacterium]